jgi:hypothetical protein
MLFATSFGCVCNYLLILVIHGTIMQWFFFIVPYGQHLKTFSFKNPIWPISCNNDQNYLHHCWVILNPKGIKNISLLENMWLDHYANHPFCSGTTIVGLVVQGDGWSLMG